MKWWGLCGWAWALAATAVADTHYVSPTGTHLPPFTNWVEAATNIQDAVSAATEGDTVLVAEGTYDSGGVELPEQPGITNIVAVTNAIELRAEGVVVIQPTLPFSSWIRCVYLASNAILSGFTLSGGRLAQETPEVIGAAFGGGGVYGPGAVVADCTIQDCKAMAGGGVYGPTVLNSTLLNNWAITGGGAISTQLANCWINNNRAQNNGGGAAESRLVDCNLHRNFAGGQGGGLFMGSATGCLFQGGDSWPGGGATFASYGGGAAQSTLDNCTLQGLAASFEGGGAYNCQLTECSIIGCHAPSGGGAAGWPYLTSLTSCTLRGNGADRGGGGIFASGPLPGMGDLSVENCIIENNTASDGAGVAGSCFLTGCTVRANFGWAVSHSATLTDCLIDGNTGGGVFNPTRMERCTLSGNNGTVIDAPMGASTPVVDCVIVSNRNTTPGGWLGFLNHLNMVNTRIEDNEGSPKIYGCTLEDSRFAGNDTLTMSESDFTNCVIEANPYLSVSGCDFFNCTIRSNSNADRAIINSGSLFDCTISGNSSAISTIKDGEVWRSTVSGNWGDQAGAGLNASFYNCTIVSNRSPATAAVGSLGFPMPPLVVTECLIEGNVQVGGGIDDCIARYVSLTDCRILNNISAGGSTLNNCTAERCFISGNSSAFSTIKDGTVRQSTVSGNWGDQAGAGLNASFYNCTIVSNRSPATAAVGFLGFPLPPLVVTECLIEGNVQVGHGIDACIAERAALTDCRIVNNISEGGSTLYYCNVQRCLISGNQAYLSGGAYGGELRDSTVVYNAASNGVGGAEACTAFDSIIYHNTGAVADNWTVTNDASMTFFGAVFSHCCTDPLRADEFADAWGSTLPPRFVNPSQGDYRLGLFSSHRGSSIGAFGSMGAISLRALLEGASGTGSVMRADLSAAGELPLTSPYRDDTRTVTAVPTNAVDWVLVRLLDADTLSSVYTRSLFLLASGELSEESGSTDLRLTPDHEGPLRVELQHRNHLPVLSVSTLANSNESFSLDFRLDPAQVVGGTNALVEAQPGAWALRAGDPDGDGRVTPTDRLIVQQMMGKTGYLVGDLNLDGVVNDED